MKNQLFPRQLANRPPPGAGPASMPTNDPEEKAENVEEGAEGDQATKNVALLHQAMNILAKVSKSISTTGA